MIGLVYEASFTWAYSVELNGPPRLYKIGLSSLSLERDYLSGSCQYANCRNARVNDFQKVRDLEKPEIECIQDDLALLENPSVNNEECLLHIPRTPQVRNLEQVEPIRAVRDSGLRRIPAAAPDS